MVTVSEKLNQLICKELQLSPQQLTKQSLFKEDLKLDSLEFMSLIVNLEDQFDLKLEQTDLINVKKVEDLELLLTQKLNS